MRARGLLAGVMSVAVALAAGAAGEASAAVVAYEGFDYEAQTDLLGKNGGSGFAGAWAAGGFNASINTEQDVAAGGSLSYPELATTGERMASPALGAIGGVRRLLASSIGQDNTTTYLSFLVRPEGQLGAGAFNGFYGLYLDSIQGEPDLFIGKPGGGAVNDWVLEARGGGGQVDSGVAAAIDQTVLFIVKAEFLAGNDRFTLYVNPDHNEPAAGNAVKTDIDLGIVDSLVIYSTGAFSLDEIRIGTTYADVAPAAAQQPPMVPLPAAGWMGMAALAGLAGRRYVKARSRSRSRSRSRRA